MKAYIRKPDPVPPPPDIVVLEMDLVEAKELLLFLYAHSRDGCNAKVRHVEIALNRILA